jgi:hypothetical protein
MKLTLGLILPLLAVSLLSIPVLADDYSIFGRSGIPGLFVTSFNSDGTLNLGSTGANQSFIANFEYDSLSQSVSDMVFSDTGTFSKHLAFTGVTVESASNWQFSWSNRHEIIFLDVTSVPSVVGQEFVSGEEYGTKNVLMECLDKKCMNDYPSTLGPGLVGPFNNAFLAVTLLSESPTPVPEPPAWIMMVGAVGIFGMVSTLRRRRPILVNDMVTSSRLAVTDASGTLYR